MPKYTKPIIKRSKTRHVNYRLNYCKKLYTIYEDFFIKLDESDNKDLIHANN